MVFYLRICFSKIRTKNSIIIESPKNTHKIQKRKAVFLFRFIGCSFGQSFNNKLVGNNCDNLRSNPVTLNEYLKQSFVINRTQPFVFVVYIHHSTGPINQVLFFLREEDCCKVNIFHRLGPLSYIFNLTVDI